MASATVGILCICLIVLICLLVFFYKKLNREANNEYTVRNLVTKEGGIRDMVRNATTAVGTRLGIQLWPESDEDDEEVESDGDMGVDDSQGGSRDGEDEEGDEDEEEEEEEEEAEDSMEQNDEAKETGDDSDGSEAGEKARLVGEPEVKITVEEKMEENLENVGEEQGKGEATGLLIDLKQFSGSAIWSEEEGVEGKCSDVTAL